MSERLQLWVTRYPKRILVLMLLTLLGSFAALPGLRNDPNPEILPPWHESRVSLSDLRSTFSGSRDVIIVMLESESGVFEAPTLMRIQALSRAFRSIQVVTDQDREWLSTLSGQGTELGALGLRLREKPDGEEAAQVVSSLLAELPSEVGPEDKARLELYARHLSPIVKVHSLADTENLLGGPEGLLVRPIFETLPASSEARQQLAREVLDNDLLRTVMVSPDQKRTGIYLETQLDVEDSKAAFELYRKLNHILTQIPGPQRVSIAGTPVTTANIAHTMDTDMGKLFPAVIVLMLVSLWWVFRIARGVLIPTALVVSVIVVTLGLQAALNVPMNVLSASLPVFLICVCMGDAIHIVSDFRARVQRGQSKEEAVRGSLGALFVPVVLTSVTTAAAFFSLAWTEIIQLTHWGVFAGVGTLISMVLALLVVPAVLMVLPLPKAVAPRAAATPAAHEGTWLDQLMNRSLTRLHEMVRVRAGMTVAVVLGVTGLATWGALHVKIDNNRVEFFSPESDIASSAEAIKRGLAGTETLNLVVESSEDDSPMTDPQVLQALDALEHHLKDNSLVGKTSSVASMVRRMNLVLHDNDPSYDRIPMTQEKVVDSSGREHAVSGKELVGQYMLLYENGGGDLLRDVVDFGYQKANVRIDLRTNSSNEVRSVMEDVKAFVAQHFPTRLETHFSGTGYVLIWAGHEIIFGQIHSFVVSLIAVLLILMLAFRSVVKGLLAIVPVSFAALMSFGTLGLLGVSLDIGSALVSSVAIGVGVDFSIHYLSRLTRELQAHADPEVALEVTLRETGPAILANALAVGLGFLALLISDFIPIRTTGWMVSLTLLTSCLATLVVLPAMLRVLRPAFLGFGRALPATTELLRSP